jgi:predicted permease
MNWTSVIQDEFARTHKQADHGVVEELAQHAGAAFEAARAEGASVDDARAAVCQLIESWCAATNGPRRIERPPLIESAAAAPSRLAGLSMDIRHAFRLLRRQPGFALVSIVMIALGIAATTSLFSVVNGVLLKPLPWKTADRLIRVSETREGSTASMAGIFTNATYHAWADQPQTIDGIGAWNNTTVAVDMGGGPERILKTSVTPSLFPLLEAVPFIGTGFTKAHETDPTVVLLSYGFWQDHFGGAADVVGKTLSVDRRPFTIIGVMPRGFEFPTRESRFWTTFGVSPATEPGSDRHSISMFSALARLKPGATPQQARSEAEARGTAVPDLGLVLGAVFGSNGPIRVTAQPMLESITKDVKPALWVMFAAVGLLFVAAIGNVANMQLAQATARRREVAIRSAIGAGSGRLARQLFVETSVIALLGSVFGFGLTAALLRLLPSLLPADFPRTDNIAIDATTLSLVLGLTAITTFATGLLPVRLARRVKLTSALVEDGSAPVGQSLRSPVARSRALIITTQVAIASVLLVGAALLSRSFVALINLDRGYTPANLMTASVQLPGRGTRPQAREEFFSQLIGRLKGMPGVTHAAYTMALPLTPREARMGFLKNANDHSGNPDNTVHALMRVVSDDYFAAMGMRLAEGRGFTSADTKTSEPVMVVNRTFARRYFTGSALNQTMPAGIDPEREDRNPWRIAGIVDDVLHRGATEPVQPEIFACTCQLTNGTGPSQFLTVRTSTDPSLLASEMRRLVREMDKSAIVEQVMTMEARLMTSLSKPRLYAVLLGGFGTFALLIAGIGLFGGLSYGVSQRTREIGVRTALGATPRDIVRLIVSQGVVMTFTGLAIGLLVAAGTVRYLRTFLFGINAYDVTSFVIVGAALTVVALVACAIPARRAARIDPLKGLRT